MFGRGEPYQSQYAGGPKGRSRFHDRYFHDEESYYGEQDYDQEEVDVDEYGDEIDQSLSNPSQQRRQEYGDKSTSQGKQSDYNYRFMRKKPL